MKLPVHEYDTRGKHGGRKGTDKRDGGDETQQEPFPTLGKVEWHGGIILALPPHEAIVEVGLGDLLAFELVLPHPCSGGHHRQDARELAARGSIGGHSIEPLALERGWLDGFILGQLSVSRSCDLGNSKRELTRTTVSSWTGSLAGS